MLPSVYAGSGPTRTKTTAAAVAGGVGMEHSAGAKGGRKGARAPASGNTTRRPSWRADSPFFVYGIDLEFGFRLQRRRAGEQAQEAGNRGLAAGEGRSGRERYCCCSCRGMEWELSLVSLSLSPEKGRRGMCPLVCADYALPAMWKSEPRRSKVLHKGWG